MFNTKFVAYKKASLSRFLDGCGGAAGKSVAEIAYIFWEKSGKPEGMSDYFWNEANKIVNPPPPPKQITDWVCEYCGTGCYYDGRCGDGPIKRCGCWGNSIARSEYKGGWF